MRCEGFRLWTNKGIFIGFNYGSRTRFQQLEESASLTFTSSKDLISYPLKRQLIPCRRLQQRHEIWDLDEFVRNFNLAGMDVIGDSVYQVPILKGTMTYGILFTAVRYELNLRRLTVVALPTRFRTVPRVLSLRCGCVAQTETFNLSNNRC